MAKTTIKLINCPLREKDHTFYFSSKAEQQAYFEGQVLYTYDDCTYQRKDNIIRIPARYEIVNQCNYVMYKNDEISTKWWYAFIKEIKYINTDTTEITIETDVIQSYWGYYYLGKCFVEREHVNDDTIGIHTIPENLQLGEYICDEYSKDENLKPAEGVIVGSTAFYKGDSDSEFSSQIGGIYNGVYSGVRYYYYKRSISSGITKFLQALADDGKDDAVSSLFLAPRFLCQTTAEDVEGLINVSTTTKYYNIIKSKPTTLNGYTPKNNKLLTYPYCYLMVNNGNGGVAEYHFEEFNKSDNRCDFKVIGALTPGCSIRLIPQGYKSVDNNEIEGLNLGKFPQCNWATDQFTNWLTQNGVNIGTGLIGGVGSTIIGIGTANLMATAGGIVAVSNSLSEIYKASRIPPQTSGNINCGDVITSNEDNTFHFYSMSIKKEYAQLIDEYFNMYGYKVNTFKVPNQNHRKVYWYTKTIDCNIQVYQSTGNNIPIEDLNKIKELYNNGITFWKVPGSYRSYSNDNSIITE